MNTTIYSRVGLFLLMGTLGAGCASAQPTEKTDPQTLYQPAPVTSGDNPQPGSIHDLPIPEAVSRARETLAKRLSLTDPKKILILEALDAEWSDACLGLGTKEESCAQMITPGYNILMTVNGKEYRYRTNADGSAIRAEN